MRVLISLCAALALTGAAFADDAEDKAAVEAAIFSYFEGVKEGNLEKLEKAFVVDKAHMKGHTATGEIASHPITAAFEHWTSGDPAPAMQGEILSIEIFHGVAAHATFDFDGDYFDMFQLAKVNGEWRIVNKFYIATPDEG